MEEKFGKPDLDNIMKVLDKELNEAKVLQEVGNLDYSGIHEDEKGRELEQTPEQAAIRTIGVIQGIVEIVNDTLERWIKMRAFIAGNFGLDDPEFQVYDAAIKSLRKAIRQSATGNN